MRLATVCVLLFSLNLVLGVTWTITSTQSLILEGTNGTTNDVDFTISRDDGTLATDIGVSTTTGTASASDFIGLTNQTVSFGSGEVEKNITITIIGDATYETNETFTINLNVGSDVSTPLTVTIINDDPLPIVTVIIAAGTTEGNGAIVGGVFQPTPKIVPFNFTMNRPSELPCIINWQTQAGTALVGLDFLAKTSQNIIAPGQLLSMANVTILGDIIDEPSPELFALVMGASGCAIAPTQPVGILDDDSQPNLNITTTASVVEGATGSVALLNFLMNVFPVPSGFSIIVNFTLNSTSGTQNVDFVLPTGGGVVIPPGSSQSNLWVRVVGDPLWEFDEYVALTITNVTFATFAGPSSLVNGTIINDDPIPTLSVLDVAYLEGSSTQNRNVTISTGAGASPYLITAFWSLVDGTATAGLDYTAQSGNTSFTGASGAATISIIGDTTPEQSNKTFSLVITNTTLTCGGPCPWSITVTRDTGFITVIDDDDPVLFIAGTTATEGASSYVTFTVSIAAAQASDIVFGWTITGGTATAGVDFVAVTPANATIVTGTKSVSFNVSLLDDTESEPTETIIFTITSLFSGPATLGSTTGSAFILDNPFDPIPTLYTYNVTVIEGDNGTTLGQVPVTLSFPTARVVNVTYSTRDESAYSPVDYLTTDGWIAFAPGEITKNITVYIVGDTVEEVETAFILRLVSVTNANFGNYTAGVIISDDDYLITAAVQSDVYEGSPAFNPRFIGLIIVIGVVLIAIIASIVGFFALKRYVS